MDPYTGLLYDGDEPLNTLKKFRQHPQARRYIRWWRTLHYTIHTTLHYNTLQYYTIQTTLHYTTLHFPYDSTLYYNTLYYTTQCILHYTTHCIRRVVGDSPIFGMHYSLVKQGVVKEGDKVMVRYTGSITEETKLIEYNNNRKK